MMDRLLGMWVGALIELSRLGWMLGSGDTWKPGTRLKLLFAGYNGARNTGADVRVEEMLRQVRHVLGGDNVDLSVLTLDFDRTRGYFAGSRQILLPDVFPPFLYKQIPSFHGVVTCEGSMFKSKFANALTVMMVGSLGMASARNRLAVGYGAEAGRMDPFVKRMTRRHCRSSLVITRNDESRAVLRPLGVPTDVGTDTAWTFQPHGPEFGQRILRQYGWDGSKPLLIVCPINPFWWPVRASVAKAALAVTTGTYRTSRYRSVYFHNAGPDVDRKFNRYVKSIARGVDHFRARHDVFCVMLAMERLDETACRRVADELGGVPVVTSDQYDMYELVSILRCADMLVSSRYHGIVTAMPGLVPSAGITMDERIRNLLIDRGHEHLLMNVDDPDLEPRLVDVLEHLYTDGETIREGIGRNVVRNLKRMARMGARLAEHVADRFPEMPIPDGLCSWERFLPPLGDDLNRLVETYDR